MQFTYLNFPSSSIERLKWCLPAKIKPANLVVCRRFFSPFPLSYVILARFMSSSGGLRLIRSVIRRWPPVSSPRLPTQAPHLTSNPAIEYLPVADQKNHFTKDYMLRAKRERRAVEHLNYLVPCDATQSDVVCCFDFSTLLRDGR